MPVPLPPSNPPAEIRPIAASELKADRQDAAGLKGETADLQQRDQWIPVGGEVLGDQVRLQADTQQYSLDQDSFVARGNVRMDFRDSYLTADELRVDLKKRIAVAAGNIRLVRGVQEVTGERLEYNFVLEEGSLYQARGVLNTKTFNRTPVIQPLPNDPVSALDDPQVRPTATQKGGILRFRAERITFSPKGWEGEGVRVTNDPFDPPELELSAQRAVVARKPDGSERLDTGPGFLIFDQFNYLPLPSFGTRLGTGEDVLPLTVGYDAQDKSGFFYQQNLNFLQGDGSTIQVQPRFFLQRSLSLADRGNNEGFSAGGFAQRALPEDRSTFGENFGLGLQYKSAPNPRQQTNLFAEINGLNFDDLGKRIRIRAEQRYTLENNATLGFTYAYRERTFNGIFGNQPVSQRFEVALNSAQIDLDNNTRLSYTLGLGLIQAPSDRSTLSLSIGPSSSPEAVLGRLQVGVAVDRRIPLYEAQQTPATREFLRYSARPVTPNVSLLLGATGVASAYTSGDVQNSLEGSIGIRGTLGQFAKDTLDFTQFGLSYSNSFLGGASPFIFDRLATPQRISANILQQVWGPIRAGLETTWDVGTGREIDRWYVLRYDRRTYGIGISYSPVQRAGIFEFRIDDFNWGTDPEGRPTGPAPVSNGLLRRRR
ncbi:DUF3769 domain-containing protein [Anthocerotibacter panamensis]|uniref:DUF3769 domain-containing protein n=1 Tax=Anthocerotibacter panamensis TaxID=2857077 RepID=UPI001C403B02|nr:DUF3769 domain-containing protein [Anthocerotibacter panamensis]